MAQEGERAVCVLHSVGKSGVTGFIAFQQVGNRIHVTGKIHGLAPGKHGFHVHQYGDLSDTAKGESAGGHWNPERCPTALRTLKNGTWATWAVEANAEGTASVDEYDRMLKLHGRDSIIGRAVVIHEKPDTFEQPTVRCRRSRGFRGDWLGQARDEETGGSPLDHADRAETDELLAG